MHLLTQSWETRRLEMEQLRREKQHYRQQMEAFDAMRAGQNRVKVQLMNMQRTERKGMCLIASDLMETCNLIGFLQ